MIKFILTLLLTASVTLVKAQAEAEEYCSIIMRPSFYDVKKGQTVSIDSGKSQEKAEGEILKDSSGRELRFHSTMQVVNHMSKTGWQLVSVSPMSADQFTAFGKTTISTERSLFIFKKKQSGSQLTNK